MAFSTMATRTPLDAGAFAFIPAHLNCSPEVPPDNVAAAFTVYRRILLFYRADELFFFVFMGRRRAGVRR